MRLRSLAASALAALAPLGLLYVTAPAGAMTAPPPLDQTWGDGGIAAPFIPGRVEAVIDFAVHPDGGAVAVLKSSGLALEDFVTVKFAADGRLDTSFGDDGMLTTDISSGSRDRARAVAVQPDGRIVVAGSTSTNNATTRFGVVRYLADGRLDPSFSGDGKTITSFGTAYGSPSAVVLRPDGRIVVAGGGGSLTAASYRADGVLDRSFDGDGRVAIAIPGDEPAINDATFDAEGNLVATGSIDQDDSSWDVLTMRIRPDGALDPAFGFGGMAVDDFGFGEDAGRAVAVQSDGGILVAGYAQQQDQLAAALSRYAPDGNLDPSFGSGGRVVLNVEELPGYDLGEGVAVLPDRRIVLAGHANISQGTSDAFVAMLTAEGALDPTFDAGNGVHTTDLGPTAGHDSVGGLALSADAKPMIAGTYATTSGAGQAIAVARYNTSTPFADLSVTLSTGANRGDLLATVRNDGSDTATDVRFTAEGSRPLTARTSHGRCVLAGKSAPTGCQLGDLAPGAEALVSLRATLDGSQGTFSATAAVSSSSYDIDFSDNSTTVDVAVGA